jgi:transcriptional regulator with XRE-family HTH domain
MGTVTPFGDIWYSFWCSVSKLGTVTHMPTGKQDRAQGLALRFARLVEDLISRHRMSQAVIARAIGKSGNYVSERMRGEKVFTLADVEGIAALFGMEPGELLLRASRPALARVEGRLIPEYGVEIGDDGHLKAVQILPATHTATIVDWASDVSTESHADSAEDFDVDLDTTHLSRDDVALAAKRGRRKSDQPHAE